MATEITRHIKKEVERELWARAAGRCEFQGCNKLLYKSPVTQEKVNIAQMAHIYSFAENGPRGWGGFVTNKKELNNVGNLFLVCHGCHETIDQDQDGNKYSAKLLKEWKAEHETRVCNVTGICPDKKSHVIFYGSKIGEQNSPFSANGAFEAMFPNWFPADEKPISLSMSCEHEDTVAAFWQTEADHLKASFDRHIVPRIAENNPNHFSVFALANQPLLILLGCFLTDKVPVEVYQLHREPRTWKWQKHPDNFSFQIKRPDNITGEPVLAISLSGKIDYARITSVIASPVSIWEITIPECHNDFLKSQAQLAMFREATRKLMVEIAATHGQQKSLSIFPAMPVACAVEMGRVRMPKADMPWIIYDQNNKLQKFIKGITIG